MGQNKTQKAAAERAKKTTAQEVQPQPTTIGPISDAIADLAAKKRGEQPTPAAATPAPATPAQPSKQTETIERLKAGWAERKVDLSKLTIKDDGKFKLVVVAEGWPTVQVGASGGITVLELKSYSKAYDAALDGLALYQKQQARETKKATPAPAQPAATTATAPAPEPVPVKAKAAA
jgi:hypothetical protein